VAQDKRTKLLTAAVEAFGAKGFHGTTTRDIALAAGMSPAAIYVHHRSKEELLYVISREGHRTLLDAITTAVEGTQTPANRLSALVRTWVTTVAANQAVSRVVKDEIDALSPDHKEEILTLRRDLEHVARRVIEEGIDLGEFASSAPHLTARAIVSLGMDVARWYRPDGTWPVDQIAEHYAGIALRLVRP